MSSPESHLPGAVRFPVVAAHAAAEEARGQLRWLRLAIAMSLVLPCLLLGGIAWYSHGAALKEAESRLGHQARVAEEHAARVIETNGVIARQLVPLLGKDDDAAIRARERQLHEVLAEAVAPLRQIQSVWLWSRDGRPLVSNRFHPVPEGLDVSDRDYFVWCRQHPGDWYVSQPALSRTTREPFFDISHCRKDSSGAFAGVVSVSLRPQYFADFYRGLAETEPGLAVSLLRDDGVIIARHPDPGADTRQLGRGSRVLQLMRQGVDRQEFAGESSLDGVARLVSVRRLEHYPLYITTGLGRAEALAGWRQQMTVLAAILFPSSLALAGVTLLALRRAQREREAVRQLRVESGQRLRAERALRQSQKLEALGQLTGGVAHDFNNLLMVVTTNAHLLARLHPELGHSKPFAAVQRAVASGTRLTRQLLAFSRRQALRPETVRLSELLPGLADLLRTPLGSSVRLDLSVDADTAPVTVDPAELELALLNLAINARDAMPGGGDLSIRVRNLAPGEGQGAATVEIAAADTGVGIPAELRERVFEPFFTTKSPGEGTGLGLSQVYGFCVQTGGSAHVESGPGQGTTVVMRLPASLGPPAEAPPALAPPCGGMRGRVLLVEDNRDVAEAAQALIRSFGCEVEHAADADAAEALLAANPRRFAAMLSDIAMPGSRNGIELAVAVRRRHPELPVLLMTGYTDELHRAAEQGFEVLPKPFDADTLARSLRAALERHALAGEAPQAG